MKNGSLPQPFDPANNIQNKAFEGIFMNFECVEGLNIRLVLLPICIN